MAGDYYRIGSRDDQSGRHHRAQQTDGRMDGHTHTHAHNLKQVYVCATNSATNSGQPTKSGCSSSQPTAYAGLDRWPNGCSSDLENYGNMNVSRVVGIRSRNNGSSSEEFSITIEVRFRTRSRMMIFNLIQHAVAAAGANAVMHWLHFIAIIVKPKHCHNNALPQQTPGIRNGAR